MGENPVGLDIRFDGAKQVPDAQGGNAGRQSGLHTFGHGSFRPPGHIEVDRGRGRNPGELARVFKVDDNSRLIHGCHPGAGNADDPEPHGLRPRQRASAHHHVLADPGVDAAGNLLA